MADHSKGVLVIDDEAVDLAVVQVSLKRAGYTVFTGANYDEGLARFAAHVTEIELLLTDISLPGKTGLDLARACLREKPALKILFMSGWVGAEFLDYVGIPKADPHFLPKPFRSSALVARVRQILASTDQVSWLATNTDTASSGGAGD